MTEYLLQRNKQEEAESMGESKSKVCSLVGLLKLHKMLEEFYAQKLA